MYGYYRKKLQGNHFWQFKGSDLKASPMIHNLQESNVNMYIRNKNKTALQLRTAFSSLLLSSGIKMCLLFSSNSIVATPGRFLHVVMEMDLKLTSVEYVVFDEADRYVSSLIGGT